MARQKVEMVFFDAGETLVHPLPSFPGLFMSVCAEYGLEVDLGLLRTSTRRLMSKVEERQRQGYTFTRDASESRRFWLQFYSSLVRELGCVQHDGELPHALYSAFSKPDNYGAYHDAHESMETLRALGLRMGLISNFEGWLEGVLENLGLMDFLEVVVISGKEDYEKPHPRIYEIALERGGVEPQRAMHVGDSPISDYDGALQAKMRPVLLDRWGRFGDFAGEKIADLRELELMLD